MAHYYGTVEGNGRTKASRTGTKKTEIRTIAASWDGAVEVKMWWDYHNNCNRYEVKQVPWHGSGCNKIIDTGIVGEENA